MKHLLLAGMLIGAGPAMAGGLFQFPHQDLTRPLAPITDLNFGTLLAPAPGDPESGAYLPFELIIAALTDQDPVKGLLAAGHYTQAVAEAERRLARAERFEAFHHTIEERRLALGVARYLDGQFGPATTALETALVRLTPDAPFAARLTGARAALGLAQQALGRLEEADRNLTRAQHLTHRQHGAENLRQLPLLIARARGQEALDETWAAGQLYRTHLKLVSAHEPADSPRLLAAVQLLADFLVANGQFRDATSLFNQVRKAQNELGEPNLAAVAATKMSQAQVFLLQGSLEVDRGLRLASEAAQLVREHSDRFSLDEQMHVLLTAGDWLTLFGRRGDAARNYLDAWQRAKDAGAEHHLRDLASPAMIFSGPDLLPSTMGYHWVDRHAYATFDLDIRPDGRPARVRLKETNLHATNIRDAESLLRLARFRPAIVDGEIRRFRSLRYSRVYDTTPPEGFGEVRIGALNP
ncbi:MAG: hypothetical protein AAGA23_22095 [Pseudomonadota bacterium]